MRVEPNRTSARNRTHAGAIRAALMRQAAQQQQQQAQLPSRAGQAPQIQGATDPYDFSADPILQRVQALGARRTAEAEARALAARRQLAIESGDESLAPDEETRQQARNNPFSTRALFERHAQEAPRQLTENLNRGNLFYSSEYGRQQGNLATSLLAEQAQNQAATRRGLSDIEESLRAAREGVEGDISQAQEGAAQRLQDRLGDLPVGYQGPGSARRVPGAGNITSVMGRLLRPGQPRQLPRPRAPRTFRP